MYICIHIHTDRAFMVYRWTDGQMDGSMDGQIDRQPQGHHTYVYVHIISYISVCVCECVYKYIHTKKVYYIYTHHVCIQMYSYMYISVCVNFIKYHTCMPCACACIWLCFDSHGYACSPNKWFVSASTKLSARFEQMPEHLCTRKFCRVWFLGTAKSGSDFWGGLFFFFFKVRAEKVLDLF